MRVPRARIGGREALADSLGCSWGQIQRLRHEALEIVRIFGDLGVATPTNLQPEIRDAEDIQAEPRS
jgi:hypothetical protein